MTAEQVEGRQAVLELLRAQARQVEQVLMVDDAKGPLGQIRELAEGRGVPVRTVERSGIKAVAATDSPQGVIAFAEPIREAQLDELVSSGRGPAFLVILDGVTDPHNLGAVMRSALAAGATGIIVGRHRASGLSPAAVKAAAGAVEHLPYATVGGIPSALTRLSSAGIWTVALEPDGSQSLWELSLATEPVALVLGSEGAGITRLARERCDIRVSIPLFAPVESLNVSAAATLACFEVARRRHHSS